MGCDSAVAAVAAITPPTANVTPPTAMVTPSAAVQPPSAAPIICVEARPVTAPVMGGRHAMAMAVSPERVAAEAMTDDMEARAEAVRLVAHAKAEAESAMAAAAAARAEAEAAEKEALETVRAMPVVAPALAQPPPDVTSPLQPARVAMGYALVAPAPPPRKIHSRNASRNGAVSYTHLTLPTICSV